MLLARVKHSIHVYSLPILIGVASLAFAIYPESGVFIFLIIFLVFSIKKQLLKTNKIELNLLFSIIFFCVMRIVTALTSPNLSEVLFLSFFLVLSLHFSYWLNSYRFLGVFYGICIGIFIILIIVFIQKFSYILFENRMYWVKNSLIAKARKLGDITEFQIIDKNNSWALQNSTWQGSGKVRYELEIRSEKPFGINIAFSHVGLTNYRTDKICQVVTSWRKCYVEVNLPSRNIATVGIGGYDTWNKNNPTLQTKNSRIISLTTPNFLEVLMARAIGFSFNENAFGAQMVIVGLLAIMLAPSNLWSFLALGSALLSIFLSGSRGALAAFAVGLLVLFIARSRFYKTLPFVLFICFAGIVFLQARTIRAIPTSVQTVTQQSGIRSLNIADKDSARGRLEIWRLATKAWLENPRTFLIGTGDLTAAMKVKLDSRATSYGLTKDTLTHAHNLWLQTAGESGLLGLLAMIWLWGWVIWKAWKARDAGALALLAAIFVINSVDYLFYYAPVHLAFWMAAAGFTKPPDQPLPSSSHSSPVLQ